MSENWPCRPPTLTAHYFDPHTCPPPYPAQVRQLKTILDERGIGYADLNEKQEMVDRILERCRGVTYYAAG